MERKRWHSPSRQSGIGYDRLTRTNRSEEACREDKLTTDTERNNKTFWVEKCFSSRPLIPLLLFLMRSLFFLHAVIAYVEERTQKTTESWTQMPVNTFSYFFLFQLFNSCSSPSILCYARGCPWASFMQTLNSQCLWALQESLYVCNVAGVDCCTWLINAFSHPSLMRRAQVQVNSCSGLTVVTCFISSQRDGVETGCVVLTLKEAATAVMDAQQAEVITPAGESCFSSSDGIYRLLILAGVMEHLLFLYLKLIFSQTKVRSSMCNGIFKRQVSSFLTVHLHCICMLYAPCSQADVQYFCWHYCHLNKFRAAYADPRVGEIQAWLTVSTSALLARSDGKMLLLF